MRCLNREPIIQLCQDEIFSDVALISMDEVVFEPSFRHYCEQNLCGKYGANYSCPPGCGTPGEMEARMRQYRNALVFQTKWDIDDWYDNTQIKRACNPCLFPIAVPLFVVVIAMATMTFHACIRQIQL